MKPYIDFIGNLQKDGFGSQWYSFCKLGMLCVVSSEEYEPYYLESKTGPLTFSETPICW